MTEISKFYYDESRFAKDEENPAIHTGMLPLAHLLYDDL